MRTPASSRSAPSLALTAGALTSSSSRTPPSPRRLKQEVKQMRRLDPDLSQNKALDLAAQARGWASFKSLERDWSTDRADRRGVVITLSASWIDPKDRQGYRGHLHAQVPLSEPWENFVPLTVRRYTPTLGKFLIVRKDRTRLSNPEPYASFESCAHNLRKAAHRLMFMDVARVWPGRLTGAKKAFRGDPHQMFSSMSYPNQDHETLWCDPATQMYFLLNEPYQVDLEKQTPVLQARAMLVHTTTEWTTYAPTLGSLAQLIAPDFEKQNFNTLVARTMSLPARFREIRITDDAGEDVII